MRLVLAIIMVISMASLAMAFKSGADWFVITSNQANPFWTNNPSSQGVFLDSGETHVFEWAVNASGIAGKYDLKVIVNSSSDNVTGDTELSFNGTIFDKGYNSSNVIPNYSCTGCAFNTSGPNPTAIGNMTDNSTIVEWNVTAGGASNTTWDVFVNFAYTSNVGNSKDTETIKARIVDYPWWNTSFNCRRMINVTQNTGDSGNGLVELNSLDFYLVQGGCGVINCTKQIRVLEVLPNKSQSMVNQLFVNDSQYFGLPKYCYYPNIKFNTTLNASETKQFFIYYNAPLVEPDYQQANLSSQIIASHLYGTMPRLDEERVWDMFYDSHTDIWWTNASDQECDPYCPSGSLTFRTNANRTFSALTNLTYHPKVFANRLPESVLERLPEDFVYVFYGHGSLVNSTFSPDGLNQTSVSPSYNLYLYSSDIENMNQSLQTKLVMSVSSFGGDNSTTLGGCQLNNWLSKAFVDKGADCYLGFLGTNVTTSCSACGCNDDSDVLHHHTRDFSKCFWGNISVGNTIMQSAAQADLCSKTCGPSANESCTNPTLVPRYAGACDRTLVK